MFAGEAEYLITQQGQKFPLEKLGLQVTGLGDIPTEYQTSKGYSQHGNTVRDWRLTPRRITLNLSGASLTRSGVLAKRDQLIRTVSPANAAVTYRRVLPSGQRRDIDGWLQSGMTINDTPDGLGFTADLVLECPDPSFYNPSQQVVTLSAGYPDALAFPFSFSGDSFWFDSPGIARGTVENVGSWRTWPIIMIQGPFEAITIKNTTTGVSFSLGVGISAGEAVRVDLTPGSLAIEDALGNSLLNYRTGGSFVDWYLQPGVNDILVTGAGTSNQTSIQLAFYNRYIAL